MRYFELPLIKTKIEGVKAGQKYTEPKSLTFDLSKAVDRHIPSELNGELGGYASRI